VHETTTLLLVTLPNIHRFKTNFTRRLSSKPFLVWLSTIPSHLKYVATLTCNLSLIACFADINVSQGSVATYARCGESFNIHLTTSLPRNFPVKFFKSVQIDRIMMPSLWPHFFDPPCNFFRFWVFKIKKTKTGKVQNLRFLDFFKYFTIVFRKL